MKQLSSIALVLALLTGGVQPSFCEEIFQNQQQAISYFEKELAFTVNPCGVKAVVDGAGKNVTIIDVRSAEDFAKGHPWRYQRPLRKIQGQGADKGRKPFRTSPPKKPSKLGNPKRPAFEKQLDLTNQWLEETFPHLFAADDYLPLDGHVLRDLKNDYRNNQEKKGYPPNLAVKAALARYKENLGYLACLKAGAPRYALDGSVTGTVTREEEEEARGLLISDHD